MQGDRMKSLFVRWQEGERVQVPVPGNILVVRRGGESHFCVRFRRELRVRCRVDNFRAISMLVESFGKSCCVGLCVMLKDDAVDSDNGKGLVDGGETNS